MRNLFPFLGIRMPLRRDLQKNFLQEKIKKKIVDWSFIFLYSEREEREFYYLAVDYLAKVAKYLTPKDTENLEKIILTKSWWDSVDNIAPSVGALLKNYPELKNTFIERCITHENFWMRRIGIIYRLKYKENTDSRILERAVLSNLGSDEFFINKAIG